MQFARMRLDKLQLRFVQRQELVDQVEQETAARAEQYALKWQVQLGGGAKQQQQQAQRDQLQPGKAPG